MNVALLIALAFCPLPPSNGGTAPYLSPITGGWGARTSRGPGGKACATQRTERTLAPGVVLVQEITPDGSDDGPQVVNVVRIAPGVGVSAALGQGRVWGLDATSGRETVSGLAQRTGALVAMNAGFFPFLGNPIGLHVEGGEIVTEPQLTRASLVIDEAGKASVAAFVWSGSVSVGSESKPMNGLNRKPGKGNELLLFTPKFFEKTLKTPERVEVSLSGVPSPLRPGSTFVGRVETVSESGDAPLTEGTVVLSAGGDLTTWLKEKATIGTELTVNLGVTPTPGDTLDVSKIRHAVTGAGRLLKSGKPALDLAAEKLKPDFSTTRHPRTAAGVTQGGTILLVTVDGRQKTLSRGMSLPELTALMQRLGAVDAVNLDGGGSTALAIFGGIVNAPSDASERPVADMLVVGSGAIKGTEIPLPGPTKPLTVGEKFAFSTPVGAKPENSTWSQLGNVGFLDQNGIFTALRPGKAIIRLNANGKLYVSSVTVMQP